MSRSRTTLLAMLAVISASVTPAFADDGQGSPPVRRPAPVSSPTTTAPAGSSTAPTTTLDPMAQALAQQAALNARYQSTTAALLGIYAQQAQTTPAAMLEALQADGVDIPASLAGVSTADVDSVLARAGISSDYAALLSAPRGLDATVAAAGAKWAQELALTHAGSVASLPSAQALGAMLARSTTTMLSLDPQGFAQLQTGAATPAAVANWTTSLTQAGLEGAGMNGAPKLLDSCLSAMLAAAGSGNPQAAATAAKGCNSGADACITAGLYFHSRLLDSVTGGNSASGVLPPADFNQLQPWQREALSGNSGAGTNLSAALEGGNGGCGAASAVQNTANQVAPSAWTALANSPTTVTSNPYKPSGGTASNPFGGFGS